MPKKPGGPNASVFVKNLPYDAKELDLKDVFGKFGRLRDVYIPLDFHTKEPRGFGYIQFENLEDADAAVQELQGFKMKGRELDIRFAEGDRKKPGQMVRKEVSVRRHSSPGRGRPHSPRQRRGSPQSHRSFNRHESPPPYRSPLRHRDHSPLPRQRHRSPLLGYRGRSPLGNRSPPLRRDRSPGRRVPLSHRSPPSHQQLPFRKERSPLGKEHMVRRQRSPLQQGYRRRMSHSPQRRIRSPVSLMDTPPHRSNQSGRRSPRERSPNMRPNLARSKHSARDEMVASSRRSPSPPPRGRRQSSPLANHRITVSTESGPSNRHGSRIRTREDRMPDRRDGGSPSRYEQENNRIRRPQGSLDQSPPRKRPIRRSPVRVNHGDRSRFSPDPPRERGRMRPVRGDSQRSPQRKGALLDTPELPQERRGISARSPRSHRLPDRRRPREDHRNARRRQSDSRRNNEEEYEFVDEEEYYEELDAMDDMDNLDINFN